MRIGFNLTKFGDIYMKTRLVLFFVSLLAIALTSLATFSYAATYLDGSAINCKNGASNYNPETRMCSDGKDTVYLDLSSFEANIAPGETNYLREGSYWRDSSSGSLVIDSTKSGTSENPTILKAYPGEERKVIIGTLKRQNTYNSNPSDTSGTGSCNYYPNSAVVTWNAKYIILDGIKTYGQVGLWGGNNLTLRNSDLGGGGPSEDQGNVIKIHSTYNVLVENNLIHNSCWGENPENGSAIIFYDASATIKNNTFYNNYGYDIFTKDSGGQTGRTTTISYNLFLPSSIYSQSGGIRGHNQNIQISEINIHNNIFLDKYQGYNVLAAPPKDIVYNNTFINNKTAIISPASGASGGIQPLSLYNNIFYSNNPNANYISLYSNIGYLSASDWNIFYNQGQWGKTAPGETIWTTTLSGWKNFLGMDIHSLSVDPDFVNASGKNAEDFKRNSYFENFLNSPYSNHSGAYSTGLEVIGFKPSATSVSSSSNNIPAPKNLNIVQ